MDKTIRRDFYIPVKDNKIIKQNRVITTTTTTKWARTIMTRLDSIYSMMNIYKICKLLLGVMITASRGDYGNLYK